MQVQHGLVPVEPVVVDHGRAVLAYMPTEAEYNPMGSVHGGVGTTNVVPVDYVARAMDHLAHQPGLDGRAFHLVNPRPQRNLDVINAFARAARSPSFQISIEASPCSW